MSSRRRITRSEHNRDGRADGGGGGDVTTWSLLSLLLLTLATVRYRSKTLTSTGDEPEASPGVITPALCRDLRCALKPAMDVNVCRIREQQDGNNMTELIGSIERWGYGRSTSNSKAATAKQQQQRKRKQWQWQERMQGTKCPTGVDEKTRNDSLTEQAGVANTKYRRHDTSITIITLPVSLHRKY